LLIEEKGRRREEYCAESIERMEREKGECDAAIQYLLHICCYIRIIGWDQLNMDN
jgi:hypothetical protein